MVTSAFERKSLDDVGLKSDVCILVTGEHCPPSSFHRRNASGRKDRKETQARLAKLYAVSQS